MGLSLSKGQSVSLEKTAGGSMEVIIMGLGWDVTKPKGLLGRLFGGGGNIDLDASCVLFDNSGQMIDSIWFRQLQSKDGSIRHTGDNLTGAGDGDDEQIIVELTKVPGNIKHLFFVVNSFTGQTFESVENAFCRVLDAKSNKELLRYDLSAQGSHTSQLMMNLTRSGNDWNVQAIGATSTGHTFHDLMPLMQQHLD